MRVAIVVPTSLDPAHRRVAGSLARELRALGAEVWSFPAAAGRVALEAALERRRPDVCHIHFFSRGLRDMETLRLPSGVRLLLTHQGASMALLEHPRIFAKLAARARWVTAVSAAGLRELRAALPGLGKKSGVVYNGVADTVVPAPGDPPGQPYLLTLGRVAAYKGLDVLALAFVRLTQEGSGLRWLACGPDQTGGEFARFLTRLSLGSRVELLGAVGQARAASLLRGCRVFVHPSRRENMPMALLEAMAAGRPVLATATGGVPEAVEHGISGLLVKSGDAQGLCRALRRLEGDARLRARLGAAAARRARGFLWNHAARAYLDIYRRLEIRGRKASSWSRPSRSCE